jgi:poly(A) polymerase
MYSTATIVQNTVITIPEIEPIKGCEQPPNFHPEGDVFVHTALVLEKVREIWHGPMPEPLALAALLHDVGKPPTFVIEDRIRFPEHQRVGAAMADQICRRLRLPNKCRELVVELVENHMRFMDAPRMKKSTLRRFLGMPHFELHLALHKGDCLGSHTKLDNYYFCIEKRRELTEEEAEAAVLPPPLAGGDDLKAMGLKPGPVFKKLLDALRDEQLEGRIKTREEAIEWLALRVGEMEG